MLGGRESIKKSALSTQGSVKRATRAAVKAGTGYVPALPKTLLEEILANEHPPSDRVFFSAVSTEEEHNSHPLRYRAIARGPRPAERAFPGPVTTDEMRRMKTLTTVHLMWLLILVLQFASLTKGVNYFIVPQNLTSETGKTVTFECGVAGLNGDKIRFYIMGSKVNDSLFCPGDKTKYLPAQSMKAYCYTKAGGDVAAWEVAGTSEDDNNTIFLCKVNTADDKIGHLYVYTNDSYYAKLIGYVIGGFLAALITIIVAYVLLKRSEKVQHCFRSVGGIQDDVQSQSKQY